MKHSTAPKLPLERDQCSITPKCGPAASAFSAILSAFIGSLINGLASGWVVALATGWIAWFAIFRVLLGAVYMLRHSLSDAWGPGPQPLPSTSAETLDIPLAPNESPPEPYFNPHSFRAALHPFRAARAVRAQQKGRTPPHLLPLLALALACRRPRRGRAPCGPSALGVRPDAQAAPVAGQLRHGAGVVQLGVHGDLCADHADAVPRGELVAAGGGGGEVGAGVDGGGDGAAAVCGCEGEVWGAVGEEEVDAGGV